MARIRNPLMSLAASGSIGGVLNFRTPKSGAIASRKRTQQPPPSERRAASNLRASWAASTWRAMSAIDQSAWAAAAAIRKMPPFGYFVQQFMTQQCDLSRAPYIPSQS